MNVSDENQLHVKTDNDRISLATRRTTLERHSATPRRATPSREAPGASVIKKQHHTAQGYERRNLYIAYAECLFIHLANVEDPGPLLEPASQPVSQLSSQSVSQLVNQPTRQSAREILSRLVR